MWCITKAKPPKMQDSYCFSVKLLAFSSVLWGNSSLIYLCVCCQVSDCCPLLFLPSWLWPPKKQMKEVGKPQRDVGKEERGKIWIRLKGKVHVHHFHHQLRFLSKLQNQLCQHENSCWPIQLLTNRVLVYSSPETKPFLQKTPTCFTFFKYI